MLVCDCCRKEKVDADVRPGLYPRNAQGKMATKAYLGFLCDDCFDKCRKPGSAENQWLLKEVGLE